MGCGVCVCVLWLNAGETVVSHPWILPKEFWLHKITLLLLARWQRFLLKGCEWWLGSHLANTRIEGTDRVPKVSQVWQGREEGRLKPVVAKCNIVFSSPLNNVNLFLVLWAQSLSHRKEGAIPRHRRSRCPGSVWLRCWCTLRMFWCFWDEQTSSASCPHLFHCLLPTPLRGFLLAWGLW